MWSAAVASADSANASALRACLQQTGLVDSVVEWKPSSQGEWQLRPGEPIPDIVVLGVGKDDMQPFFAFAILLRKARPNVLIIASGPQQLMHSHVLLQAMRGGFQDYLTAPVSANVLRETLSRFTQDNAQRGEGPAKKLIVIMGTKGGVGTSTVAVNLGAHLAQNTKKSVVLLDLGRPMGHVSLLLDLHPRHSIRDAAENLDRLDSHFFSDLLTPHKTGLKILAGSNQLGQWQQISVPGLTRVVNVAQSTADFVLMDYGSIYSPEWNPVLQLARMILLVAEPNVPSLWALERLATALAALGHDPDWVRIIINRWSRRDDEALKTVEKNLKRTIFARLPNDFKSVSEATNLGMPLAKNHKNPLASEFDSLANQIAGISAPEPPQRSGLTNWFFSAKAK